MEESGFFDNYPVFFRPPVTELKKNRLNIRYKVLIENNKNLIFNNSILDIACHDGTWSFASIMNGAKFVCGIEGRENLVKNANKNFQNFEISKDKYQFVHGDIHHEITKIPSNKFQVVFCFGFFYHTIHHMFLLEEIKRLNPKYLILDTGTSSHKEPIIELTLDDPKDKLHAISSNFEERVLVGKPSKLGLDLMLKHTGFQYDFLDWHSMDIKNWEGLTDYQSNRRVTIVAKNLNYEN